MRRLFWLLVVFFFLLPRAGAQEGVWWRKAPERARKAARLQAAEQDEDEDEDEGDNDEDDDDNNDDKDNDNDEDEDDEDEDDEDRERDRGPREVEALGRTVHLSFFIQPERAVERKLRLHVTSAATVYAAAAHVEDENGEHGFEVRGRLRLQDDGKILVTCEAEFHRDGEDGVAHFEVESSVALKPGTGARLAGLADKILVVHIADAAPPAPAPAAPKPRGRVPKGRVPVP
jgi:hypothetical protein